MEPPFTADYISSEAYTLTSRVPGESTPVFTKEDKLNEIFQQLPLPILEELLTRVVPVRGKKSFLVFKHNKYITIPTEAIAFFYIKYESPVIMCFDSQEYFLKLSLEQLQNCLPAGQFFRLNRQYLINFSAVKEVEHYRARKLLINPVIQLKDQLLVPKRKVTEFLCWLDNR